MDTNRSLIKISETLQGKVYKLIHGDSTLILKFFFPIKTTLLGGYNLEPLLNRDRVYVSSQTYQKLKSFKSVAIYLPTDMWIIPDEFLIITNEKDKFFLILSNILEKRNSLILLPKIKKLTKDWIQMNRPNHNLPRKFNNKAVWSLKLDLQIKKPLSYIFAKNDVSRFVKKLGKLVYFSHGDLQPKNILVSGGDLEVVDFEEGFNAPLAWDVGFLWGNLLYLTACYETEFKEYYQVWISLRKEMKSKSKTNFTLVSVAIFLMRIYMFPLEKSPKLKEQDLRKTVTGIANLLS